MTPVRATDLSRRDFVRTAGGVLIGFSLVDEAFAPRVVAAQAAGAEAGPAGRLDAWLRIQADGTVRVFTGKAEIGMGVETAFAQIVAEELNLSADRVHLTMGDTSITPDQGGVGGSTSIAQGARPLRNAAATANALLLQLASQKLAVPIDELTTANGMVTSRKNGEVTISYGALAESADLRAALSVSGQGFALDVAGAGQPKKVADYSVVGTSVPRKDLPSKILGQFQYVGDIRVPGMLHGRLVRPPAAGATVIKVDEASIAGMPGEVRAVVKGNFVGVLATTEWAAIRAARTLAVTWSAGTAVFPKPNDLYSGMRSATPRVTRETLKLGDVAAALGAADRTITAGYEYPFQSHATMGPGCAIADVHMDGLTTVWCGAQKPHALQRGLAELIGRPAGSVRVIWVEDAGWYGRPGFEDAAADAVLLSQAVGRPVRVQWTRADMTLWGAKGPPVVCDLAAGLGPQGELTALRFVSRALSGTEIVPVPGTAGNFLAAQLTGVRNVRPGDEYAHWGVQTMAYTCPNVEAIAHVLPPFQEMASPLRTTHLRDPNGPAATFAAESFIDEIASAVGADPLRFRLDRLDDARARAVLVAAAERAGWQARPSPVATSGNRAVAAGRGIAVGARNGTYVATVADVEVTLETGAVRVTRLTCAQDCGLIINPESLKATISANLVQSLSRTLREEVRFDEVMVTSVDWSTYPVIRTPELSAVIDIVLVNRTDLPAGGAGEASTRPTAAAIGNAIFDATGARIRRVPFTPPAVKTVLARVQSANREVRP